MDDIWVFGDDEGALRAGQVQLQQAMAESGLLMNFAKTHLLSGPELRSDIGRLEHSATDYALLGPVGDVEPLRALIASATATPEITSRTTVRFITSRIQRHELFSVGEDLLRCAHRMPHGADYIAGMFRKSGGWRDLGTWFIDHANSTWNSIEWSLAGFASMFPASERPLPEVRDYFADRILSQDAGLPMQAVAAQRLSVWDPSTARAVMRSAAPKVAEPLVRRVFGLALASAGEDRATVRDVLSQCQENAITLAMLEDSGFRAPKALQSYAE